MIIGCAAREPRAPSAASRAAATDSAVHCAMLRPSTVTARLAGCSRCPLQSGHGVGFMSAAMYRRTASLLGLAVTPLEVGDDAPPLRAMDERRALLGAELEPHLLVARAVQEELLDARGQLLARAS